MTRPSKTRRLPRPSQARPAVEALEGRLLPSGIGFNSAIGVGVTGQPTAIHANALTTDPAGDSYVTGSFRGTVAFDPSSSSSTFTTAGTQDTFVAKYGPTGSLLWARTFAGQSTTNPGGATISTVSQGSAIALDGAGNLFVAGSFDGTISVAGPTASNRFTSVANATEPYVAKLDGSGHLTWFDAVAGTGYDTDSATSLAPDGSGGVIFAGSFADDATFGQSTLAASGASEAFASRVNALGSFVWAVASRGANGSNAQVNGVAVDGSGNVDLAGFFSGTVDLDPSGSKATLASAGSDDALLWKLDPAGEFVWARSYGSADYDAATAVSVDASGNLYATGSFSDTVNFGTTSKADAITAGPIYDAFVLKVDPQGKEAWVDGLVGPIGSSKGQGVAVDAFGTVDVAGTFSGPVDFDPRSGTDTLTSLGLADVFEAGYDTSTGGLIYALQAGQSNFNAALGLAVNTLGVVSIAGTYSGPISFGAINLPSVVGGSFFVAQTNTLVPPPAPSAPVLDPSSDTGASQSDGITSVTSPVLDVAGAIGTDTVELLRNGVLVAQRVGPGPITDPGPLADGTYIYTAIQVNLGGFASPASPSGLVTILTALPATLPAPTLLSADDSGTPGDGITNVNRPRLSVPARGGTTVQLVDASGSVIGSIGQAQDGTAVIQVNSPLGDGVHPIQARAVDVAGNVGLLGPASSLTIDTTPPAAPTTPSLLAMDDSGTPGDDITNVRQPRLAGRAEPNSTVTLVNAQGGVVGTSIVGPDGTYTVKPAGPLADGTYAISARATDPAGNVGPSGSPMSLTILTSPPPMPLAPSILPTDVSGPVGGTLTNVRQPRITGSARPGSIVGLFNASGTMLATALAGSNGLYTAKIAAPLADGVVLLDAIAVDPAGNPSPPGGTLSITIDATPPAAPTTPSLSALDDSGTLGDNLTNVRQPRLNGKSESYATVILLDAVGNVEGSAVDGPDGSYTARLNAPLADGNYAISARATDLAGNVGPTGPALNLSILATPPTTPAAPSLALADDSGGPGLTNVRQPRLMGRTGPNLAVQLLGATGAVLASTTSGADGTYLVKLNNALSDGTYPIHAAATDAAGNVSLPGATFTLTILATPPASPSTPTLLAQDDSGVVGDKITNVRQPRLTGTAPAGLLVRLVNPTTNQVLGSSTATSGGLVTIATTSALGDGTYPLSFVAVDAAGNASAPGGSTTLTILATPAAPARAGQLAPGRRHGARRRRPDDGPEAEDRRQRPPRGPGRLAGIGRVGGRLDDRLDDHRSLPAPAPVRPAQRPGGREGPGDGRGGQRRRDRPGVQPDHPGRRRGRLRRRPDRRVDLPPGRRRVLRPEAHHGRPLPDAVRRQGRRADQRRLLRRRPQRHRRLPAQHLDLLRLRPGDQRLQVLAVRPGRRRAGPRRLRRRRPVRLRRLPPRQQHLLPPDVDHGRDLDPAVRRPRRHPGPRRLFRQRPRRPGGLSPQHRDFLHRRPALRQHQGRHRRGPGGTPTPADFEGLGRADPAVYQPGTSSFQILMSATNTVVAHPFGGPGDVPVPGDYLGTGRADLAVYRPSNATFYALDLPTSAAKVVTFGTPNVTMPTLAPITSWFSFGGGGGGLGSNAATIRPPELSAFAVAPAAESSAAFIPITPDLALPSSSRQKARAVDQAIESLGLESGRPGV